MSRLNERIGWLESFWGRGLYVRGSVRENRDVVRVVNFWRWQFYVLTVDHERTTLRCSAAGLGHTAVKNELWETKYTQ